VLAQEEVWIRKGIEARRTRNEGRVRRLEALRRERAARRERVGHVELALDAGERSGKLVAELEHVSKRFGQHTVVRDFSARLLRGDKAGLIGPNGSGKTTLLKLILGELKPDEGSVHLGTRIEVAYFDQFRSALQEDATLVDTISQGSDTIEIGGRRKHVISYLEEFLFPPERARAQVKSLSGGERNRLLLARLFSRPANVLVLDEPTNDLDVETLELLEELLQDYAGTLFLVSHDRTFLDNVVTQTIAFEGDGAWREYAGGYSDWEKVRVRADAPQAANASKQPSEKTPAAKTASSASAAPQKPSATKLNAREKRELDELPAKLEALEQEHAAVQQRLADPALYRSDATQVKAVTQQNADLERSIASAYARWEELEARKEGAPG
jgi:ATP-binding cassette subfamily F protein uup